MQPKNNAGVVIALDGPDGVGKTTQLGLLAESLKQKGHKVHTTRSSGGTPIGEELRKVSLSDTPRSAETDLYISLAMGVALAEDIQTHKKQGEVVLIDRSPLAIVAYNGYGSQLKYKRQVFEACQKLCTAYHIDALLFFSAGQSALDQRLKKRGGADYFEKQGPQYQARVREGYQAGLEFLQKHATIARNVFVIDATSDIETVHRKVVETLGGLQL